MREDCTRTATIITDEDTDIIVLSRELYNRSVDRLLRKDLEVKEQFVAKNPLFTDWPLKWKKALALSFMKRDLQYEETLFRQGDEADKLFFVVGGEIRLTCEPDSHRNMFSGLIESCHPYFLCERPKISKGSPRADTKLKHEENKQLENWYDTEHQIPSCTWKMSPSQQRKKARAHSQKYHLCVMGVGQQLGDTEILLNVERYFATAKCTKETSVYWIHKEHFERLFRKKNPHTLKSMSKTLVLLMKNRSDRDNLASKVPLLKCLIWKLQEISGQIKRKRDKGDEILSALPDATRYQGSRPKSHGSSKSVPNLRRDSVSYSISSFRSAQFPVLSDKASFTRSSAYGGNVNTGSGLVYSMPNLKRSEDIAQPGLVERHSFSRGDGIFMKLLQVGNPNLNRKHLDIDDDELEYLISLRRRMARKLEDFHPCTSLDRLYGEDSGSKRQKSRSRSQPKSDAKALFPAIKGGKQPTILDKEKSSLATDPAKKKKPRGILFKID